MHISSVQNSNSNTSFGTRYGARLKNFINANKEILTHDNFRNLSMIRNNGIDSVLELEHASLKERELYKYKYKLTLTGGVFDKKDLLMNSLDETHCDFRKYINKKYSDKPIASTKSLSVPIEISNNIRYSVARQFDSKNMLFDRIEKEFEQAKRLEAEFKEFEKARNINK